MNRLPSRDSRSTLALILALLLGAGYLAFCIWWTMADLMAAIADDKVATSVTHSRVFGPVLIGRAVWFALALLLLHLTFGLLALGLARLTAAAAPAFAEGRRLSLVVAWFILLAAVVWMANTTWYPGSRFAPEGSWLQADWRGLRPVHVALAALLALVIALAWRAARQLSLRGRKFALASGGVALLLTAGLLFQGARVSARPAAAFATPHVVIIGLDSLRNDLAGTHADQILTPQVDKFLSGAYRFSDTISPLARTYGALMSLLTGRDPVSTNARFNLMPRKLVHEGDTLGDALQAHGYHAVFAIDEVRFANFDESFGFNQLVTPPVGASDFLFGTVGDLPLVNLLSPTRLAAWLFPSNHANRAASVTYRPGDFLDRLDRELVVDQPEFLHLHLTLSHWPYSWAGLPIPTTPQEYRVSYRLAIAEVDRQFGEVMRMLERKGVLENAIVVVLSDHGEALGGPTDSMLRKTGTAMEIWDSLWGHGTSVMSPHQYSVLLAMKSFGRARIPGTPAVYSWPVSLEDVRPTLQELVTGIAPEGVDGVSLVPYLREPATAAKLDLRVRYTETDFNTPKVLAGNFKASGLIHEGAAFYEIVPETGWMQLRPDRLPELMARKQRAALSQDSLLAYIPSWTDSSVAYLFADRHTPLPRRLQGRPDPADEPEAARLWDALHARFRGELAEPAGVP